MIHPISVLIGALGAFLTFPASAHGGGLNSEGCHNNRKTGDYHCHWAPLVGAPLASTSSGKTNATASVAEVQPATPPQHAAAPTCFVGPRGGTYTITASGRKNYSGC